MSRRVLAFSGAALVVAGGAASLFALSSIPGQSEPADIAFERGKGLNPAIYVMSADGGDQREVIGYGSQPTWSPGGGRIAFVVHSPPDDEAPADELWVVEADGGDARRAARDDWIRALAWAPDGSRIAWVGPDVASGHDRISVVDLASGERRALEPRLYPAASLDWSPDGRELLTSDSGDLVAVDVLTGRTRTVRPKVHASKAVWSPDGGQIAYAAAPTPRAPPLLEPSIVRLEHSIFVVDVDGGRARRLTRGAIDSSPSWAPRGEAIAFSRWEPSRSAALRFETSLWGIDASGTKLRRLTNAERDSKPDWRPRPRTEPPLGIVPATLPEPSVRVPDVGSLDVREAARAIETARLRPLASSPGQPRPSGKVFLQSPGAGARVPPGTVIRLVSREEARAG